MLLKKSSLLTHGLILLLTLGMMFTGCSPTASPDDTSGRDTTPQTPEEQTEAPTAEEDTAAESMEGSQEDTTVETETEPNPYTGASYYVDSVGGDDGNDGLTPETAIKTLEKANSITLKGGESLLLKAGCTFVGCLSPKRERDGGPIRISSYGEGDKPRIEGNGENALGLFDFDHVEVSELYITNPDGACGIYVRNVSGGALSDTRITDCVIEKVNVDRATYRYESGGIICASFSDTPGWFDGLVIENNQILDVGRSGVFLTSLWANRPTASWGKNEYVSDTENWWPAYGVVVRGNYIDKTGGDGIVLIGTDHAVIEYNTVYRINTRPVTPCANAGIWPQSSNDCLIQYNEVAYAQKPAGVSDATGFDVDASCRDTIVQYNYSHDNQGGFILLCESSDTTDKDGFTGTIVRNNVSFNDGEVFGSLIPIAGPVRDAVIEQNTIIYSGQWVSNIIYVWSADGQNQDKGVQLRNNIIYCNGGGNGNHLDNATDVTFEGNLYWGTHKNPPATEVSPIVADPLIEVPRRASKGLEAAKSLAAAAGSPVYNASVAATKPADKDFAGNPTDGKRYVGAFAVTPEE